jgi:phosphatidylserine decarboxylase
LKLTRYGKDVLIAILIISVILFSLAIWTDEVWLRIVLIVVGLFLSIFSLNFFRDPDRTIQANGKDIEKLIISPADGLVVGISEIDEQEFLKCRTTLISIFMSPMDVHVNRAPINGKVEFLRYVKGEFLVADHPESTHRNERMLIGMAGSAGRILFAQVAGYIARRIVCEAKIGDTLKSGERFGMIKFGSRVDVFIPIGATILVKNGDRVSAGATVLAEFMS